MRNFKATLLAAGLAGYLAPVHSQDEIPRQQWMTFMEGSLPTLVCRDGGYFRSCFDVSAEICRKTAADSLGRCLQTHGDRIPDPVGLPHEGTHWGQVIGSCAGTEFELELQSSKRDDPECRSPAGWQ